MVKLMFSHAPLVIEYHAFLKTLYECMFIVNCLMFRLAERNEYLSTVEATTSPFVKGKWHMKIPIF